MSAGSEAGDEVLVTAGTVIVFDTQEMALVAAEAATEMKRPPAASTQEAFDMLMDAGGDTFLRIAHAMLNYIEQQIAAGKR